MIELHKKYSGKELAELLFEVSANTFNAHKQEYLIYMSEFYEWHNEGKKYVFTKQLKEYVPKKKGRKITKDQTIKDYETAVYQLLKVEPWNTGAGIARDISLHNTYMIETYNHKPRTSYNYIRPITKEKYDIVDKRWKAPTGTGYIDMADEEIKEWKTLLNACFGNRRDISFEQDLAILKDAGDITEEEYKESLAKANDNKYQAALALWEMKYGYKPIRVNKYELKMIEFKGDLDES